MTSTVAQNYEQLSYRSPASQWRGQHAQIISNGVATKILSPRDAGSVCMFDVATGTVYTLPVPVAGMTFTFFTTVTVTSNAHAVATSGATVFLLGAVTIKTIATAAAGSFAADGTSIVTLSSNGSTTGGVIGGKFTVTALNSTQWAINGCLIGSGGVSTPFA